MSVHKRNEKQADGTIKVTWRSITRDQNGKRIFRTFRTRADAVKHDQDAPAVYKMLKRAEREDRPLDDIIDFAVESGVFARRAPIEKALDRIDLHRNETIRTLVARFLADREKGAHGRSPLRQTTIDTYRHRLAGFVDFFEGKPIGSISSCPSCWRFWRY